MNHLEKDEKKKQTQIISKILLAKVSTDILGFANDYCDYLRISCLYLLSQFL